MNRDALVVGTDDGTTFAVTRRRPVLDFDRALREHYHVMLDAVLGRRQSAHVYQRIELPRRGSITSLRK